MSRDSPLLPSLLRHGPLAALTPRVAPPARVRTGSLQRAWARLSPPLQVSLMAALAVLSVWLLAAWVVPAYQFWRDTPQRENRLREAEQQVQALAAQAQHLRAGVLPRMGPEQVSAIVRNLTQQSLGESARVAVAGGQITVTLQSAPAAAMAQWLALLRERAATKPHEVSLRRDPGAPLWSGRVVLLLPAAP